MSAIAVTPQLISEMQMSRIAGVVQHRGKVPATTPIKMFPMPAPKMPQVESGVRAKATRPTFGQVRISTYPMHMAGMDKMGFMT